MKTFFQIREKSVSQSQQKMMGMALAYKRGEMDDASPEVKKMADSMSMKDLEDFAKTKHKGLPKKVEEGTLVSEKLSDDDWVHINRVGSFNSPKKDSIVGYSKAGKDNNRAPKLKPGANQAMRVKVAKEKGYVIKESVELDEAFSDKEIKMAIGVASDKRYAGGNMTGAVSAIEKIKKGLSNHPQVKAVLQRKNESVQEATQINENNTKFTSFDQWMISALKAKKLGGSPSFSMSGKNVVVYFARNLRGEWQTARGYGHLPDEVLEGKK